MTNQRELAINALIEVTDNNGYNNIVLNKYLKRNDAMKLKDKSFVTEVFNGTLRNLIFIDYVLEQNSSHPVKKMKPFIRALLRISVYQIKFMDTPNFAAVNESVNLVKKRGYKELAPFVNALLRNVIRQKVQMPDEKRSPEEYLSVKYSIPLFMIQMWLSEYDYLFVKNMCEKNNKPPKVSICTNTLKTASKQLKENLALEGVKATATNHPQCLRLSNPSALTNLDSFQKGYFHVQDKAAMRAVELLAPEKGQCILDACASPGGKAFYAAQLMQNEGEIYAWDIFEHKINLITQGASRLGICIIKAERKDATVFDETMINRFDKIIVDAPCSGFGLLRKKPDIKLKKTPEDIESLSRLQRNILTNCIQFLKPSGELVYATCTLSRKENQDHVTWLTQNEDFTLLDIEEFFPHIDDTDGFFMAKCRKN